MASTLRWEDLEFRQRLGEGQAGEVWTATLRRDFRDLAKGDLVAVKRYKQWLLEKPGQLERIYRELAIGMRVNHPNIVKAYCLVNGPENLPCLVMRFYQGETLEKVLEQRRTNGDVLPPEDAFRLLRGIANGVQALHASGTLHRDIKPANVIVQATDGTPIVMDLGVVTETLLPEHTGTADFMGTIRYAYPEYLSGAQCGCEADVYSIGGVAYEIFFGQRFMGDEDNWAKLVARLLTKQSLTTDEIASQCKRVESLHGLRVANAVWSIIYDTLRRPTVKSLGEMSDAIEQRFWEHPFYFTADGFQLGVPPLDPGRYRKLDDVITDIPLNTRANLRRYIGTRYWDWRCGLADDTKDPWTRLESDLTVRFNLPSIGRSPADNLRFWLTLYRYELL